MSSDINDEVSIDFGRGGMSKYSGRISGYLSNYSTYDGGLKFYSSTSGTLNATPSLTIASTGAATFSGRVNVNGAGDNSLFSLNTGGTLYTTGFSPNASTVSSSTYTITTGTTTLFYTGTTAATWTLPNPSGTNQMFWIKNASAYSITLNAYSGTNIINNAGVGVTSITILAGATALIQQDGNVKSFQLQ